MVDGNQLLAFVLDATEGRDLALGIHAKSGRALKCVADGKDHVDLPGPPAEQPASLLREAGFDVVLHPLPAA
jgi:hypothetical protein